MLTSTLSKESPFVDVQDGITLAHAIVDTVRDPLVVLDNELRVVAASRSFYRTFRLAREDVRGHLLYEIDNGQWDIPELRETLRNDLKRPSDRRRLRSRPRVSRDRPPRHAAQTPARFSMRGYPQHRAAGLRGRDRPAGGRAAGAGAAAGKRYAVGGDSSTASPTACKLSPASSSSRRAPSNRKRRGCNWRTRISGSCRLPPFSSICMSLVAASRSIYPVT